MKTALAVINPPEGESPYLNGTTIQWAWDSTTVGTLMECHRKYYYAQIRGLRRKRLVSGDTKAVWGQAFHLALETYTQALDDNPRDRAIELATAAATDLAKDMPIDESGKRTMDTLARSIKAYVEKHAMEPLVTLRLMDGTPAVELSARAPLDTTADGIGIEYCGHFDRLVEFQGMPYVLDTKTTGQSISTEKGSAAYFSQYTLSAQISGYSWLAKQAYKIPIRGAIIDAMQVAKTKTEFARNISHRTPGQVNEWEDNVISHINHAISIASEVKGMPLSDQARHYRMNTSACHSKFGPCPYAQICGKDPAVREAFLATDYEHKPWNPLAPRTTGELTPIEED